MMMMMMMMMMMVMMICLSMPMSLPSGPNLKNVSLQLCSFPAKGNKQLGECEREWEDNTAVDLKGTGYKNVHSVRSGSEFCYITIVFS